MEYLSVAEFAEAAGVTPQAIYKRLKTDLEPYTKTEEGAKMIDSAALKLFKPIQQTKREKELLLRLEELEQLNAQLIQEKTELVNEKTALLEKLALNNDRLLQIVEKQAQQQENFQVLLAQNQQVLSSSIKALPTVEEENQELNEVENNLNKQGFFHRIFHKGK